MVKQNGQNPAENPMVAWDTEERFDLAEKEGHIRNNSIYLTAALVAWMDQVWGGIARYVKTATNLETADVIVAKAKKGEPGAMQLRRIGAQNAAIFNFWRPLKKLDLKVPEDRQFNVTPYTQEIEGVGTVFVFPLSKRVSVPRNLKEEAEAEAADAAAAGKQPPEKPAPAQAQGEGQEG